MKYKEESERQDTTWAGTVIGEAREYVKNILGDNSIAMSEFSPARDVFEITGFVMIGETRFRVDAELNLGMTPDEAAAQQFKVELTETAKRKIAEDIAACLIWQFERHFKIN